MAAMDQQDINDLPPEIYDRGIDVGAVVILETSDNKILLTKRAMHMRTFPGVWVPPGGHIGNYDYQSIYFMYLLFY